MRALLIPSNPDRPVCDVQLDELNVLADLQALVGGDIEALRFPEREDVMPFVNDEGKLAALPANQRATELLASVLMSGDWIAGDLVLTGFDAETGDTVDLPEEIGVRALVPRAR